MVIWTKMKEVRSVLLGITRPEKDLRAGEVRAGSAVVALEGSGSLVGPAFTCEEP